MFIVFWKWPRHVSITKTYLYNFDPLKPHFYVVKLGFTGVYTISLISAQKHRLWVLVRTASQGSSNEYLQSMFWAEIWKRSEFLSENFQFLVVKFSIYLNRPVFILKNVAFRYYLSCWGGSKEYPQNMCFANNKKLSFDCCYYFLVRNHSQLWITRSKVQIPVEAEFSSWL